MKKTDYYEFLQISPNAEEETIHRVYRFLAARYHPDNTGSGNAEMFATLTAAYEVLSNSQLRLEYDSQREKDQPEAVPLSDTIDFMNQLEGENNRRVAFLAVLYYKRRSNPLAPQVPLAEIETRMGFPREYLDFTTWYLHKKGFISKADNSDFTLTATGVDFVESQRVKIPILNKLLTAGAENDQDFGAADWPMSDATIDDSTIEDPAYAIEGAISVLPPGFEIPERARVIDRRQYARDRRTHSQDQRVATPDQHPIERRMTIYDRRSNPGDRRANIANGHAVQAADGHTDAGYAQPNSDRPMDIAAAMDRLIAMVDESMDEIYGQTGEFANSLNGHATESARESGITQRPLAPQPAVSEVEESRRDVG
ncbi:MAG TPA: DnaJ domain-containing protein [Acidobacteriaceae bacterium]|nr:DnaJ domain-containing protein [Acidobacteriaceae bacterium]